MSEFDRIEVRGDVYTFIEGWGHEEKGRMPSENVESG